MNNEPKIGNRVMVKDYGKGTIVKINHFSVWPYSVRFDNVNTYQFHHASDDIKIFKLEDLEVIEDEL